MTGGLHTAKHKKSERYKRVYYLLVKIPLPTYYNNNHINTIVAWRVIHHATIEYCSLVSLQGFDVF